MKPKDPIRKTILVLTNFLPTLLECRAESLNTKDTVLFFFNFGRKVMNEYFGR